MKYEDFPEIKEVFVYGFNFIKIEKVDNCILIGCNSDELYENDKLFKLWSNKFRNKHFEMRNFKKTG